MGNNARKRNTVKRARRRERRLKPAVRTLLMLLFLIGCVAVLLLTDRSGKSYRVLTQREIARCALKNEYDSPLRRTAVEAALGLVGKVHYFWGGKYYEVGECPEWGVPRTVTGTGNSTSGTVRPFGLDCSGFVTWCYAQTGMGKAKLLGTIGDGTWNQWMQSSEIDKADVKLGDIAFFNAYPGASSNHVGIVVAFTSAGAPLIAHCSSGEDNVVVTTAGDRFVYFRTYDLSGLDPLVP